MYQLCWCSAAFAPDGVCNEGALFETPAGQIRVGTSKEFQYTTRVEDPETRSFEPMYGLLLLGPLLLVAASLAFFGWKKISTKNNKFEHAAPHPFPPVKAWASGEQDRLKLMHTVKQVNAQRKLALGTEYLSKSAENHGQVRAIGMDIPENFSGKKVATVGNLFKAVEDIRSAAKAIEDAPVGPSLPLTQGSDVPQVDGFPQTSSHNEPSKGTASLGKRFLSKIQGKLQHAMKRSQKRPYTNAMELRGIQEPRSPDVSLVRQESPDSLDVSPVRLGRTPQPQATDGKVDKFRAPHAAEPHSPGYHHHYGGGPSLTPVTPIESWEGTWDEEEDGPMPPGVTFPLDESQRRREVLVRILDL
jgi:hypothetical protein